MEVTPPIDDSAPASLERLIPVRSERQAMDWSLVLASQEIHATILRNDAGWALQVENADYERSLATIRQYRLENRRWAWRHRLPGTALLFDWGALAWGFCLIVFYVWSELYFEAVPSLGVMDSTEVHHGEWWRLFTAVCLHADLAHLAANLSTGLFVLGLAMGRFGPGQALLASFLAGALGNYAGLLLYSEPHRGLGASGMVMGGLGLLTVQSAALWRESRHATRLVLAGSAELDRS